MRRTGDSKMNKKMIAIIALLLCALLLLSSCGSQEAPAADGKKAEAGSGRERVVIYTAAEDERIAYLQEELNKKFPDTEIVIQSLGTGQLLSRLQAEGKNSDCDIFYDLEVVNAEIILNAAPDLFADLSGAFLVNTKLLEEKGLPVPETYEDMLKPEYAGLISMPSPKSSGTGYSYYNGMVTLLGEEAGMKYFEDLNPNIKEYTTSGSAPAKAAVRGDVMIAYGLLWQCVNYANENEGMTVVVPAEGLAFDLFTMGMISGHETKQAVKDVFTYLYSELNKPQCAKFNPDKIYADMPASEIKNYPEKYEEITMKGLFDFAYKQDLLDKWKY